MQQLQTLQRGLLLQTIRQVRSGGRVVYCTCSFAREQNGDIVEWALEEHGDLVERMWIQPVNEQKQYKKRGGKAKKDKGKSKRSPMDDYDLDWNRGRRGPPPAGRIVDCGKMPVQPDVHCLGAACFHPRVSGTSGLFIAVLRRK